MNPFRVNSNDSAHGSINPGQPQGFIVDTTVPGAQYYGTRAIAMQTGANFATINSNFYQNVQTTSIPTNQQLLPQLPNLFPQSPQEVAETVAKEERRRRNTAASARFRQKKKQREEDLETGMARVQDRNVELEERVNKLELENKWLKDLVIEKNVSSASRSGDDDGHEDDDDSVLTGVDEVSGMGDDDESVRS